MREMRKRAIASYYEYSLAKAAYMRSLLEVESLVGGMKALEAEKKI